VKVIRRPRYGCRACEEAVVQAPAPERPISGGMATEALLAHVLVAKFSDHLPLYRQAQIFGWQGIELDRSTLCDWVGRACWWLEPLWRLLRRHVMSSSRIFADDTRLPVLDPGRGRTKIGCLWGYAVDDRPWGGETPPAVVYLYAEDRKGEHPAAHLAEFQGVLQVDGYAGFKSLLAGRPPDQIKLAFCWAHCRRGFYELYRSTSSPLAEEALRRIGELYRIETEIRGHPAEERRMVRQERSKPIVEALHAWLTIQLGRVSGRSTLAEAVRRIDELFEIEREINGKPAEERLAVRRERARPLVIELEAWLRVQHARVSRKSEIGKALAYALNHWQALIRFLDDGRICISNNAAERALRGIPVGRRNWTFAGSDRGGERAAAIYTLIETAKLNAVDPQAWLADVLARLPDHPAKRITDLLPWNWRTVP
jgi:transposase